MKTIKAAATNKKINNQLHKALLVIFQVVQNFH